VFRAGVRFARPSSPAPLDPTVPLTPKPKQHTTVTLPASALRRYIGSYSLSPQFVMDVTLMGDTLHIRATGQNALTLLPE
jgi:hypothetical protein